MPLPSTTWNGVPPMESSDVLQGYPRANGVWGVRNHTVVMSVVGCAAIVLQQSRRDGVVMIPHQYGCGHIGTDVDAVNAGMSDALCHPNVGASILVGLGCESISGSELAARIAAHGHDITYLGIQESGGTASTVDLVDTQIDRIQNASSGRSRVDMPAEELTVGVVRPLDSRAAVVFEEICQLLGEQGYRVVPIPLAAETGCGDILAALGDAASARAHIVLTVHAQFSPPQASPIVPVVAIGADEATVSAFGDDFDLDASRGLEPDALLDVVRSVISGRPSRTEQSGIAEFSIRHELRAL